MATAQKKADEFYSRNIHVADIGYFSFRTQKIKNQNLLCPVPSTADTLISCANIIMYKKIRDLFRQEKQ